MGESHDISHLYSDRTGKNIRHNFLILILSKSADTPPLFAASRYLRDVSMFAVFFDTTSSKDRKCRKLQRVIDKISSLSCQKVADSITSWKMGNHVAKQASVPLRYIPEYIRRYPSAYCSTVSPCLTIIQIGRTPRHQKLLIAQPQRPQQWNDYC